MHAFTNKSSDPFKMQISFSKKIDLYVLSINLAVTTRRVISIFKVNIALKRDEKICFYAENMDLIYSCRYLAWQESELNINSK